jgi:hypothetical protein
MLSLVFGLCVGLQPGGAGASQAVPTLALYAGNGTDTAPTPGPATGSSIGEPLFGIAFDTAGNAYVDDIGNYYVYKITPAGTLSIFAGNGTDTAPTPGPATASSIGDPEGLAFDSAGNLYIADDNHYYVYKVTPGGTLSIFAGNGTDTAPTPGPATSSSIGQVDGLSFDSSNDLYIVSFDNYQVYKVTPGGTLSIFAGNGTDTAPTPGPATSSSIGFPEGIATDHFGDVLITDQSHYYVYKVIPGGTLSIFAGNGTVTTPTPGPATSTSVGQPQYLAFDSAGDAFLSDDHNDLVYQIKPGGSLSVYAGNETDTAGTPGPAASSAVGEPEAIGVNAVNDVFVIDEQNYYVYKITPATPGAPLSPTAAFSNGAVTASWQPPSTGGAPATYTVTPTVNTVAQTPVSAITTTSFTVANPTPGATYSFAVEAVNGGGTSPPASTNSVTVPGGGYDLAGSDGGVFVFPTGQASGFFGSLPGLGVKVNNVVGIVPTNNFNGYNLVGSDGGVFVFPTGQASGFFGSLPGLGVKVSNVVGIVPTNNDQGYDLVGSDGGVFVFPVGQSAGFFGSLPGLGVHVNDIVGIVASPGGGGYFLVGRDGGVFTFGNAPFFGSLPGIGVSVNNITGIASTPDGQGYYLVGADGAVYAFGDATSHGSLPGLGVKVSNVVSIVPTPDGGGYWLIGSDGGVFAFGDATSQGSLPGVGVHVNNIVGAVPTS